MKKTESVTSTAKIITYFCDICEEKLAKNDRYVCTNCGKDLCREHSKPFIKDIEWRDGFAIHTGRSIKIYLCLECRVTPMAYEEALEKMGFRGR